MTQGIRGILDIVGEGMDQGSEGGAKVKGNKFSEAGEHVDTMGLPGQSFLWILGSR